MSLAFWRALGCAALVATAGCAPYHETHTAEEMLAAALQDDEDGVDGDADACPRAPEDRDGFEDGDGCPDADNDGDGWVDVSDACPAEVGGAGSTNGCKPKVDSDGDGLLDEADRCAKVAETRNGYRDDDGCPDVKVWTEGGQLRFDGAIEFEAGTNTLTAASGALIPELASYLTKEGAALSVEVGVHTDDVGADKANLKLSGTQANALRDALIAAGVGGERITAVGYGETKPVVKGTTEDARSQNRRIELKVK